MTEPYRNEVDTLEARKVALESELTAVNERLQTKKRLPTLEGVRIASPCSVRWDDMLGDGRVRHCGQCEKNVFNISGMSRADAESLIHERVEAGEELCLRLYKRSDGTILTDDCPVGLRAKIRWRVQKAILAGGIIALAAASAARYFGQRCVAPSATSGAMEMK